MVASEIMPTKSVQKEPELEQELEKKIESIRLESQAQVFEAQAQKLGLTFSDLKGTPVEPEALALLDEGTARAGNIAILYRSGPSIVVAVTDPTSPETKKILADLKARLRVSEIKMIMTTPQALERAWGGYKTIKTADIFRVGTIEIREEDLDRLQEQIKDISDLRSRLSKVSVTQLLEVLIAGALKTEASDIHFEPEVSNTRLRYRLDGLLHDISVLDNEYYLKVLNRIKVLAKLKLNIHRAPQDGRFTIKQKKIDIEVRASILPSEYGETIVMRLLDPRTIRNKLGDLGMRQDILTIVKEQLKKPNGAILTTGPTGSGKTTTLYAFVNYLNSSDTKIITIEDPIEYHITGISQTQVDPSKEYTFANGLRAIVRQDPDIILVGEIRDTETADIALNAALTGHLVFSTIHTNDAAGTIPRLIDLGIRPQVIAPAVTLAMAQRLLRKLCEKCKKAFHPTDTELEKIREQLEPIRSRFKLPELDTALKIYAPKGCEACNGLGYKGRTGVYEAFTISKDMEKLILTSPAISDVRDLAAKEGMVTMTQDGYLKLLDGITSLEEIGRILG